MKSSISFRKGPVKVGSAKTDHLLKVQGAFRCTDIKNLCFENFNWTEKKICFTQSKTGQPMELPLVPDVGWGYRR